VISGTIEAILLLPAKIMGCRTISVRHLVPFVGNGSIIRKCRRLLIEAVYGCGILFADQVVCVSEAVAEGMRKIALHRRIQVIPNWVPSIPEKNVKRESARPIRLLFVGRLEHHKGLHLLLNALDDANEFELTVVGDGIEGAQLRQMAQGKAVHFEGFQSDTARYYRNADIFIMPSLGPEGLPLVTLEAMSHALPCILSDLPAHVDVSCGGANALLFETGQVESLRTRLQNLANSTAERILLGDRAYRHVLKRYSPAVAKKNYLSILSVAA
jgi:glycosyltransferase involved in cell wall biosynthesis